MLILLIKSLKESSNMAIIEFINFICLATYTVISKKSIPHTGFIKMVSKAPKIAEINGIKEMEVNCCFIFSLL
tara:strand:+ start:364 stop:582 length:219 start_codon:yes stop_codon:yes gene_type:complete